MLIYFILRHYCICKYRCFQKWRLSSSSVTHGISAFLVLCFAKINILGFGIIKYTELFYINGTSYRKVVSLQGDIMYFGESLYNAYAIISLFTIVIIITVPTMIFVFHPVLIRIAFYFQWGESRFILLINKLLLIDRLKPVLDTFQGDYKDKMHFFAGLHFIVYRLILLCIVVMASIADTSRLYLLVTIYFLVILIIHVLTMPFKRYFNNAAHSLVYFLLITVVIMEYYSFSTGNLENDIVCTEFFLLLLPLFCIVFYCLWKISIAAKLYWKKHKREGSNDLSLVRVLFMSPYSK